MIYQVKFVYNDGKDLLVNVAEANTAKFFEMLSQKNVFYDTDNNLGFWTDLDKVRYVEIRKIIEENRNDNSIPIENIEEIPTVDGDQK